MHSRVTRFLVCTIAQFYCSLTIAAPEVSDGRSTVTLSEVSAFLLEASPEARVRLIAEKQSLSRFVANQLQDRRIAAVARDSGFADRAEIRGAMEKAQRDVLVSRFLDEELTQMLAKAPDFRLLAKERYEVNRIKFVLPEAVRVAHILIPVDVEDGRYSEEKQRTKAEDVLSRLKAGEDFGMLAKVSSGDRGSLEKGGELPGWVERGKLAPPFEREAFGLKPGQMSGIVRTRFGFHIIKTLEHRAPSRQPFSAVEAQLVGAIRTEFQAERRGELIKRFAGTQEVQFEDAFIEALKVK